MEHQTPVTERLEEVHHFLATQRRTGSTTAVLKGAAVQDRACAVLAWSASEADRMREEFRKAHPESSEVSFWSICGLRSKKGTKCPLLVDPSAVYVLLDMALTEIELWQERAIKAETDSHRLRSIINSLSAQVQGLHRELEETNPALQELERYRRRFGDLPEDGDDGPGAMEDPEGV